MQLSKNVKPLLQNAQTVWIAVSGGMDSMVLLDCCRHWQNELPTLKVIHVDHGLQLSSKQWAQFVIERSEEYGLSCVIESLEGLVKPSSEEKARQERYRAIFSHMGPEDVLLTAHHLEDQKETFLFRAFRGTGIHGLVGMCLSQKLYGHTVLRPFYQTPKSAIIAYAKEQNLSWVEDPSNGDSRFRRNEIRKGLSVIKKTDDFVLTQKHLTRQSYVLQLLISEKLSIVCPEPHILSLEKLRDLEEALQLELFHSWLSLFVGSLSYQRTQNLLQSMLKAREDRYPKEKVGEYTLVKYRSDIALLKLPALPEVDTHAPYIDLDVCGRIHNPSRERIQLLGGAKAKYKKQLQNNGIPNWLRCYIPYVAEKELLVFNHKDIKWEVPKEWQYWF